MQQDDVVWQIINNQHCSFKLKTVSSVFCRNEYNVTGLCNRQSCPLANSQYATVRQYEGRLYLLKKVVERAHMPAKLWERVLLPTNAEQASEKIEKELEYWPGWVKTRCSQRFARITEVLRRMRKIDANADNEPILLPKKSKQVRRDRSREERAHQVARLESTIETELLERLQKGVYGEIYNFHQKAFDGLVKSQGAKADVLDEEDQEEYERMLAEMDDDEFIEALSEEEQEDLDNIEQDLGLEQEELMADLEDMIAPASAAKKMKLGGLGGARKRSKHAAVELEHELEKQNLKY